MNPLVLPFGMLYFSVERSEYMSRSCQFFLLIDCPAVVKNQLLHVYAKNYEGNAKLLMIRMIRYSFDGRLLYLFLEPAAPDNWYEGLILMQASFTAYMAINKLVPHLIVSAILIAITAVIKIVYVPFNLLVEKI
jgi:hypothetical protein